MQCISFNPVINERTFICLRHTRYTLYFHIFSHVGPNSRQILSSIIDYDLTNESMPPNSAAVVKVKGHEKFIVRILRVSFVGELGYELHIPKESCVQVYNLIMKAGESFYLRNAGYRSLYSLSSEKGLCDRKK